MTKSKIASTDGCGFIGLKLAKEISKNYNNEILSGFQIRTHGAKGMLALNV